MPVALLPPAKSFKLFVDELHRRAAIRLVRVADYGLVEPSNRHGAWVMQPMVRVIATALDRDAGEIVQYREQRDANQMVTVIAGTGTARHNDFDMVARKDQLATLLRDEGFQVEDGEWTAATAQDFLDARRRAYG